MALALMDKDEGIAKQQQQQQLKKGHWTPEEDLVLKRYIESHGEGKWTTVSKRSGLMRGGKSCRMRWMNYLRPNLKHGNMSQQEEDLIIRMHKLVGNRWALIAGRIHGRTDNEIKNYWNTYLSKRHSSSSGGNDHHQNTSYNNNNNNFIHERKRTKVSAQLEPVMVSSSTTTTNNTDDQSACNSLIASTITSESTLMEGSSSNNDQIQIFNCGSAVNNLKNNKTMGPELIDSNKSNCQYYYEDTVYCEDEEPFSPALMNCMIESLGDHQIGVDSWMAAASGLPPPPLYLMEESYYPVDHLL